MWIEVRGSNLPISEALEEHVLRRLDLALRRFATRIDRVVVRLAALEAPNRRADRRCRIAAYVWSPPRSIIVEAIDADVYVAVSQAAARLEERVAASASEPVKEGA